MDAPVIISLMHDIIAFAVRAQNHAVCPQQEGRCCKTTVKYLIFMSNTKSSRPGEEGEEG